MTARPRRRGSRPGRSRTESCWDPRDALAASASEKVLLVERARHLRLAVLRQPSSPRASRLSLAMRAHRSGWRTTRRAALEPVDGELHTRRTETAAPASTREVRRRRPTRTARSSESSAKACRICRARRSAGTTASPRAVAVPRSRDEAVRLRRRPGRPRRLLRLRSPDGGSVGAAPRSSTTDAPLALIGVHQLLHVGLELGADAEGSRRGSRSSGTRCRRPAPRASGAVRCSGFAVWM